MKDDEVVGLVSVFSDADGNSKSRTAAAIENVQLVDERLIGLRAELSQLRDAKASGQDTADDLKRKERELSRLIRQAEASRQIFEMRAQQLQQQEPDGG